MYIAELITLAIARLSRLDQLRGSAAQAGDVVQLAEIDRQIVDTQSTLDKLNTL